MIAKMEINGIHADVDNDLHKYVVKKLGHLDKYLPKHARESAHIEVKLKESKAKDKRKHTCEVILYLPHETLNAKETTLNIYAAVDIAEARLKSQIRKYKDIHTSPKFHRRLVRRLRRKSS